MRDVFRNHGGLLACFWAANISMGCGNAIVGSSLPFLAKNVNQSLTAIGFAYTARSLGFVLASIVTGFVFRRLSKGWQKTFWIAAGLFGMAVFIQLVPFVNNIIVLFVILFIYGIGGGMMDTANNSLIIFLLGPVLARPIVQSLHFCVAVGAFILPFMIRPFLEQMDTGANLNSTDALCSKKAPNITEESFSKTPPVAELARSPLVWPYAISTGMFLTAGVMVSVLSLSKPKFDKFTESSPPAEKMTETEVTSQPPLSQKAKVILIVLVIMFYWLICGTENVFWSHLYAFGICSKLAMSIGEATNLNKAFFAGFLVGRGSGVIVAKLLRPGLIIAIGSSGCLIITIVLSIWSETNAVLTMAASAFYGYSVAMLFAAGICWLAAQVDVTGAISSTWFIGAYSGVSSLPPLAGAFFNESVGPIGMMYLVTATSAAFGLLFALMNLLVLVDRRRNNAQLAKKKTQPFGHS